MMGSTPVAHGPSPPSSPDAVELPRVFIDRLAHPFIRFLHTEAAGGAVLLFSTVLAVALPNSPWADAFLGLWDTRLGLRIGPFEFGRSLRG